MDKLEHRITEGGPYFPNAEVDCFQCWHPGKILGSLRMGEYDNINPITAAELATLITIATEHKREKQSHNPVLFEFRRNKELEQSKSWTEMIERKHAKRR